MSSLATRLRLAGTSCFMTLGALVMLLVAVPTFFAARRFYSEVMARWLGEMVAPDLGASAIAFTASRNRADVQTIYVSNHSSTLDVFVLIALGLPRTRFFLSGFLRKMPPSVSSGR